MNVFSFGKIIFKSFGLTVRLSTWLVIKELKMASIKAFQWGRKKEFNAITQCIWNDPFVAVSSGSPLTSLHILISLVTLSCLVFLPHSNIIHLFPLSPLKKLDLATTQNSIVWWQHFPDRPRPPSLHVSSRHQPTPSHGMQKHHVTSRPSSSKSWSTSSYSRHGAV